MGNEENFSIYSAHPDEYTFPVSKLKKIHLCSDTCQKRNPGSKCFKYVYRAFSPKKVQHLCPPNCQFTRTYPEIPHVSLNVGAEEETLVEGLPFLDSVKMKLSSTEDSWGEEFKNVFKLLSVSRSPSLVDLEELDELGSIFSITIGRTDVDEMGKILKLFHETLLSKAKAFYPMLDFYCGLDVEGQRSHAKAQGKVPAKLHFGNFGTFLEINIPMTPDKTLVMEGEGIPDCLNEFFNQEKLLFVGNNMAEDIDQIEFALTLLNGSTWKFTGKWLDTCVLWTSLGGWSKSVGLASFRYQTLGGFLLKHFKLSCAPDWALSHKELSWEYTVYNIGDITTIMGALYMFFLVFVPTLIPSKSEFLSDISLSSYQTLQFIQDIVITQAQNLEFNCSLYQSHSVSPLLHRFKSSDSPLYGLSRICRNLVSVLRPQWRCTNPEIVSEFKVLAGCLECSWTGLSLSNNAAVDSESDLDLELHCEDDIEDYQVGDDQAGEVQAQLGDDQVGDDQAGEDHAQNFQADRQLNIGRISRYSANRCTNPSGYNPSPEVLKSLQSQKVIHVQVDRHGREYTWGAGGDWRNYLSCKEMIKEQGFQRVLELAVEEPYRVLGWFNAATPWGALPSPTNFRFGNPKFYIKLRKKVEQQLGIVIKNRHPYYKVRGGRKNRRY